MGPRRTRCTVAQEVQTEEGDYIVVHETRAPEGDLGASATLPVTASVFDKADIVRKPGQSGANGAACAAAAASETMASRKASTLPRWSSGANRCNWPGCRDWPTQRKSCLQSR